MLTPDKSEPGELHRVLYLLPVEKLGEARYGDGLAEAARLDLPNRYGVICVLPEFSDLRWYADHPTDNKLRQEAYFINEVLPMIESSHPVVEGRAGRMLVGFSKSGWGAFSLLLRHPNLFDKAAAWDAPLTKTAPDQFGMGPIFGTQENFARYQITKSVRKVATSLGNEPRLFHLGYGAFREHHTAFESLLGNLNVPHVYHDGPAREHNCSSGWLAEATELLLRTDP
ncbi:MAG: hypothetical protein CMJ64_10105 [Planctomycetaceae bacterium]|nr:hypothetical protein [Planctomycetaceae bacterium]